VPVRVQNAAAEPDPRPSAQCDLAFRPPVIENETIYEPSRAPAPASQLRGIPSST
jgi:hypothetical protein